SKSTNTTTKRLCLESTVHCEFLDDVELVPGEAVAGHGVDEGEQLAHAGDDDDLAALAGGAQPPGEGADDGVEAHGRQRRHVQHAPQGGPAAGDGPAAVAAAGAV